MYQLYAYGTKYKSCEKLYLIYPKDELEEGVLYNYFKDDLENKKLPLEILFFDLKNLENNIDFIPQVQNNPQS